MAEEIMQEQTVESIPAAQEPSTAGTGEIQQVQADTTARPSESQPEPAQTEPQIEPEIEEWHGNDVDKLPKQLQGRARGILQHLHKVSQEAAAVKQQAQAFQEIVNHPEFQEFLKWQEKTPTTTQNESQQQPFEVISEDEFLVAQTDPAKFVEMQKKILMREAAPLVQKLQAMEQELATFRQEKVHIQASQQLDSFAKDHPDFWDINPTVMKASLEEVVKKNGGTIEQAYTHAKTIEKDYLEKANGAIKGQIDAKKKAVTSSPSKSMEPAIIYANNKQDANRIAFENAQLGKTVDVRVKNLKNK